MTRCPRCYSANIFSEDIEPDGAISLSCCDCGEVIPTDRFIVISAGSPIMYSVGNSWPEEPKDYFGSEDLHDESPKYVAHSEDVAAQWEAAFLADTPINVIAANAGKTRGVVYGVLRRRMGTSMRKYNNKTLHIR